ncbi:B3 domain-containing protein At3g06220-like isoform X1 [Lycium ferocissimum]|uniref:B3 domain-containing protein At3g06220-like isoform X1 n=1 Tax=Lycium ferocissimum TaxID=112874 RepID=UPI0028159A0D|nr:B3 domain-containing protein At3g06220-like isoform X1 [Lycium ferocissimum]XP_059279987.1 B3 domain-containing protein At3g06220-like isoform X1 [Lycium ferocissimum]XP_059279988.1 B3 domain-containing protein At3g06220-like isoform X1 [Lycium ferocissimum]XP_059279989.1 B3 domain-containing protein At3g06220-like isoform X1 [Lycium ferocissimum]XP_059279990.1 B3 domain-containing protein At3g06220-like isoform X1 [Lycium ferocissimum]
MDEAFIPDVLPEFFLCFPQTRIPPAFLKFFNGETPALFVLEGPAGRSWQVGVEQIESDLFFKRGWPDFVEENNLEYGDFLTFCYAGNSKLYVKIYEKDGCLKQDQENVHAPSPPAPTDQAANESGNSNVSITLFELVMNEYCLKRKRLTIPAVFGNRFMKRGEEKIATLRTGSDSWQVKVCRDDRFLLRKGIGKFMCDNNLRVGDACRFELIDEEEFIMVVHIRRFPR